MDEELIDENLEPTPPEEPGESTADLLIEGNDSAESMSGGDGNETIYGAGGNDTIDGAGGNDEIWGGPGNDDLAGGLLNDTLYGEDGEDSIQGEEGDDLLWGSEGSDSIEGGIGQDTLEGEEGNDLLIGGTGSDTLRGGLGSDRLSGGSDNDLLEGGAGNNLLEGEEGDDSLIGGDLDDYLNGGVGNDSLDGGLGADNLVGEDGSDVINAGDGNDFAEGGAGEDSLNGASGNDTLLGGAGNDSIDGGEDNDNIVGDIGNDYLAGGAGEDLIDGGQGSNTLIGGAGNDTLLGGIDIDSISGGDDADQISADRGDDSVDGGYGNDVIFAGDGNDTLLGNLGDDSLEGELGNDSIDGGEGNDTIFSALGDDYLLGNTGDDSIRAGEGDDTVSGGSGNDSMDGGTGFDIAVYDGPAKDYRVDYFDLEVVVSSQNGRDVLKNFELVQFSDGSTQQVGQQPWIKSVSWSDQAAGSNLPSTLDVQFSESVRSLSGELTLMSSNGQVIQRFRTENAESDNPYNGILSFALQDDLDIYQDYRLSISQNAVEDLFDQPNYAISDHRFKTASVDGLYHFFVVAFAAAPGSIYMGQLAEAYNYFESISDPSTLRTIVEIFTTKTQFTSVYPAALYREDSGKYYVYNHDLSLDSKPLVRGDEVARSVFDQEMASLAQELVERIVKQSASEESKAQAVSDVRDALALGGEWTIGKVIYTVFGNLATKPLDDADWGNTALQFNNQTVVARYLTETMQYASEDVEVLRSSIAAVSHLSNVSNVDQIISLIGSLPAEV